MQASETLQQRLLAAIDQIPAVDIHTNISPEAPFASDIWDLLGCRHITEQACSAGLDIGAISGDGGSGEKAAAVMSAVDSFDNTVQYGWVMDIAREIFDFPFPKLSQDNWQQLDDAVRKSAGQAGRAALLMKKSNIEKVFVSATFWEDIAWSGSNAFTAVLNANDLIFGLEKAALREKLKKTVNLSLPDSTALRDAFDDILKKFLKHGCAAVSMELPAHFDVFPVVERDFDLAVEKCDGNKPLSSSETIHLQCGALFALAELCNAYGLPVLLQSGAVPDACRHGVDYGRDLPAANSTLHSLLPLFNSFPRLNWCVSVSGSGQAQELAAYCRRIQNVIIGGQGRFQDVPWHIESNVRAWVQSIPKTKLLGCRSDIFKLEFGFALHRMYRRIIAQVLADNMVITGRGNEEEAISIARYMLRDNAFRIFGLTMAGR